MLYFIIKITFLTVKKVDKKLEISFVMKHNAIILSKVIIHIDMDKGKKVIMILP